MPETADRTTSQRSSASATDLARTAKEARTGGGRQDRARGKAFQGERRGPLLRGIPRRRGRHDDGRAQIRVTALIGSSGCGKTTVLRSLNRMHELTPGARVEGEVTLDDQNIYARNV